LIISGWWYIAIGIAIRKLIQVSKMWEIDGKGGERAEDSEEEFAAGDDIEELEINTFRYMIV
jgi:hypothetical protein